MWLWGWSSILAIKLCLKEYCSFWRIQQQRFSTNTVEKKKHLYKVWKMRKSKSRFVGNASSFQTSTYSYHYQVSWSGWSWFCWLFHSSLLRTKNSKRVIANNKKKKSVTSGALLGPSALCLLCNNPLQNCHQNKWMYHHLN